MTFMANYMFHKPRIIEFIQRKSLQVRTLIVPNLLAAGSCSHSLLWIFQTRGVFMQVKTRDNSPLYPFTLRLPTTSHGLSVRLATLLKGVSPRRAWLGLFILILPQAWLRQPLGCEIPGMITKLLKATKPLSLLGLAI